MESLVGWRIPVQEIEILALIGNGAFGKVSKGRYNSEIVAIKQLHPQRFSEEAKTSFRNEAMLMKDLGHPRVLIYRGFFENDQDIGIVMEFMENGSLLDAIESKPQFQRDTIITIAYDIASGLNYLHLKDILHHDLKPANVFLDRYDRAKVGDFGLSVIKSESSSKVANSAAGTMAYLGPECFGKNAKFVKKSDVYAYAMVLWETISWEVAYKDVDPYNVTVCVRDGERLPIPDEDFGLGQYIEQSWAQDFNQRPNFTELLLKLEALLPVVETVVGNNSASQSQNSRGIGSKNSNQGVGIHGSTSSQPTEAKSVQPSPVPQTTALTLGSVGEKLLPTAPTSRGIQHQSIESQQVNSIASTSPNMQAAPMVIPTPTNSNFEPFMGFPSQTSAQNANRDSAQINGSIAGSYANSNPYRDSYMGMQSPNSQPWMQPQQFQNFSYQNSQNPSLYSSGEGIIKLKSQFHFWGICST